MKGFLNEVMEKEEKKLSNSAEKFPELFKAGCDLIVSELGEKPFHVRGPLNAAVMDGIFSTILIHKDKVVNNISQSYEELINDATFTETTRVSTSDKSTINKKIALIKEKLLVDK